MSDKKNMRICLVASAGGHLSQLLKLAECWDGYELFCITTSELLRQNLPREGRVYVVGECNRQHPLRVIKVLLCCIRIVWREKPHVIISTGAAVGCIACFLGKLVSAKIVWIDSITNVDRISLSGRMVRYIAYLFLLQWPDLAGQYKSVENVGEVI